MEAYNKLAPYIKTLFHDSADLIVRPLNWPEGEAILCQYSVLANQRAVNEQIDTLSQKFQEGHSNWGDSSSSTLEVFHAAKLVEYVSKGETVILFTETNLLLRINLTSNTNRSVMEPDSEHIIQGAHDGFVENMDINIALIRKRLSIPDLVVKKMIISQSSNSPITYMYIESKVSKVTLDEIEYRLRKIETEYLFSSGQLADFLEDTVWSPFPQLMTTERPDKVATNLMEGRVVLMVDNTPTVLLGPVTFGSYFQSPDDFNGRVLVGTFYRLLRIVSFLTAIFLPAFYIAVVSFHYEVLPYELSKTVKIAVNEIPYRPFIEAMILEITIELIREASIRLPSPIGQTIGIVGGLVIGDAIVSAGLVSNVMVIVVALTAISSFVIPSIEMNTTIRLLRYPFMLAASVLGFFGIVIGTIVLFIHLINLRSFNQPYFYPIVPFRPRVFKNIFMRLPYTEPHNQATSFSPKEPVEESGDTKE